MIIASIDIEWWAAWAAVIKIVKKIIDAGTDDSVLYNAIFVRDSTAKIESHIVLSLKQQAKEYKEELQAQATPGRRIFRDMGVPPDLAIATVRELPMDAK